MGALCHGKNHSLRPRHGYAKSITMPTDEPAQKTPAQNQGGQRAGKRRLDQAAERALAEAAARRAQRDKAAKDAPREVAGRGGLDPARYGDWEINGLISDF
jgi:hypothetical protein